MSGSMIGRTFSGRYRIVERIGIGGMAGKPGERMGGGYTPYKTSGAAPSRPSGPSFSAGIKPSFK